MDFQNVGRIGHIDLGGSSGGRSPVVRGCGCFYYPQSTVSNILDTSVTLRDLIYTIEQKKTTHIFMQCLSVSRKLKIV